MRSELTGKASRIAVRQWARRRGLFTAFDGEHFYALSPWPGAARRVLRIDASPGRHSVALGRALGYPACCCLAARRHGDEGLDAWAEKLLSRTFIGPFRRINPGGYLAGKSSISHVPCSPRCEASLRMARTLSGKIEI